MSVENSVTEDNSKVERKNRQLDSVKRLIKDEIPSIAKKNFLRENSKPLVIRGRGEDAIHVFKSKYEIEENHVSQIVYMKELDLRKYTSASLISLSRYFSEEELLLIDITSKEVPFKNADENEVFKILKNSREESSGIVMVRNQQEELEEDMFEECYFFLVDYDIDSIDRSK